MTVCFQTSSVFRFETNSYYGTTACFTPIPAPVAMAAQSGHPASSGTLPLWPLYEAFAKRGGKLQGDSKQLVDMVATTSDTRFILDQLYASRDSDESLDLLVSDLFLPPGSDLEDVYPEATSSSGTNDRSEFSHTSIMRLLRSLTKRAIVADDTYSTLIPAPNPFVIPAGRFRERYVRVI